MLSKAEIFVTYIELSDVKIKKEEFLVINNDLFCSFDIRVMKEFYRVVSKIEKELDLIMNRKCFLACSKNGVFSFVSDLTITNERALFLIEGVKL